MYKFLHYCTWFVSSFDHPVRLPFFFLYSGKIRNDILRRRVRRPNLAPRTIGFYHQSVRGNGGNRKEVFFRFERTGRKMIRVVRTFPHFAKEHYLSVVPSVNANVKA